MAVSEIVTHTPPSDAWCDHPIRIIESSHQLTAGSPPLLLAAPSTEDRGELVSGSTSLHQFQADEEVEFLRELKGKLAFPLWSEGQVLGVLTLNHSNPDLLLEDRATLRHFHKVLSKHLEKLSALWTEIRVPNSLSCHVISQDSERLVRCRTRLPAERIALETHEFLLETDEFLTSDHVMRPQNVLTPHDFIAPHRVLTPPHVKLRDVLRCHCVPFDAPTPVSVHWSVAKLRKQIATLKQQLRVYDHAIRVWIRRTRVLLFRCRVVLIQESFYCATSFHPPDQYPTQTMSCGSMAWGFPV